MAGEMFTHILKYFTGEGDVVAWIKKFELVAKLQKNRWFIIIFFPLYFEGDALTLYLELDASSLADVEVIKNKLQEAFSDGPFSVLPSWQVSNGQGNKLMCLSTK